jgi:hypothetical protein
VTELAGADASLNISEIKFFGTPGPTTLDKGSLTLGRSLDVPRISRYDVDTETPRPEKLVVDFDTTVNNSPTDISGKGNHGTLVGATYSAADKAFKTTNGGGNVRGSHSLIGTQPVHSHSVWFKQTTDISDYTWVCAAGTADHQKQSGILISGNSGLPNRITFDNYGGWVTSTVTAELNRWYHVVATFNGGTTFNTTNCRIYVDGVDCTGPSSEVYNEQTFNLQGAVLALGSTDTGTRGLTGLISNYKLYDVVLEPSEVQKLYRLGRTGRSMVISDTAVGIGKVPEVQLDVRGTARFAGGINVGANSTFGDGGTNLTLSLSGKAGTGGTTYGWVTLDPNDLSGTSSTSGVSIWDALHVQGTFTATTGKGFLIDHPNNPTNKKLFHTAIEAPRLDLMYRGITKLAEGKATVNIDIECVGDPECAMENGTFEALCRDPVYYLQNTSDFDRVMAVIEGGMLKIVSENPQSTSIINWMVIAERKDREAINATITNDSGRVLTEIVDTSTRVEKDGSPIYPVSSEEVASSE